RRLSSRRPITSARVDPRGALDIVRPLRCGGFFGQRPSKAPVAELVDALDSKTVLFTVRRSVTMM
ncbi:MAG: hypothetical protein ACREDL_10970, partial [Bradyrhizobium sp.]